MLTRKINLRLTLLAVNSQQKYSKTNPYLNITRKERKERKERKKERKERKERKEIFAYFFLKHVHTFLNVGDTWH